jgi:hypothetical protein
MEFAESEQSMEAAFTVGAEIQIDGGLENI